MVWQLLILIGLIVIASVAGGSILAGYTQPSSQISDNSTIIDDSGKKIDIGKWLWSFPGIAFLQNMLSGIWILTSWIITPFSWVVCIFVNMFNHSATCPSWTGWLIFIPIIAIAIWSWREKFERTAMIFVIILVVIFIIGIILMLLGIMP